MSDCNLRKGFIKIMKDYKEVREYVNIRNKEKTGEFDKTKELEKNNYSEFVSNFEEYIGSRYNNYTIKMSKTYPIATKIPFISFVDNSVSESIRDNFYISYLCKPNGLGFYLTLCMGVYSFKGDRKNFNNKDYENIMLIRDKFKKHILEEAKNNDFNIDFNLLSDTFDLEEDYDLSKAYASGVIFSKYYEYDRDHEENFVSDEKLNEDLKEYLRVYKFALNYFKYFNTLKIGDNQQVNNEEFTFKDSMEFITKKLGSLGTIINANDYDGLIIRKLPKSDSRDSKTNNALDIRIGGKQRDMFPYLCANSYLFNDNPNSDFKTFFFLKIPISVKKSNLNYLISFKKENYDIDEKLVECPNENLESFSSVVRAIKKNGAEIIELSSLRNFDGEFFDKLREILNGEDYLVILKLKENFKYESFGIPNTELDESDYEKLFKNKFYYHKNQTNTIKKNYLTLDMFKESELELRDSVRVSGGENILLYGVPGSGKSWTIQNEYCDDESRIERVVFHPDYTYSDFIGQILPHVSEGKVDYKFTEGPFTSILKKAWENPCQKFYLIIEEINRGNAPAIFGDVFQLLDRKKESDNLYNIGTSEYGITNSDIADKIYEKFSDLDSNSKVRIPSNLFIIATMNTADQNVFTLDTAFQRRWNMRLIPNKFDKDHGFADNIILESEISWKQFVMSINDLILDKNSLTTSSEDKRLGVYFIQENDLKDSNKFAEKVLKYLWDDAFKFSREDIFKEDYRSLEDIIDEFNTNKINPFNVFKEEIYDLISKSNNIK